LGRGAVAGLESLLELPAPLVYAVAFVVAWAESAPGLGILVPGQTLLVGAGFLSVRGPTDPFLLGAVVAVGSFLGDLLGFGLGRVWGVRPTESLPGRLRLTPRGRLRIDALFARHGAKAVILARFQPVGRAFGPYLAGATGMTVPRFLLADAAASLLAGAALVGLGYLAGLGFERLSRILGVTAVGVVTLLLVAIVALGLRLKHRREE
jgi:membrane-associated protein